MISTGTFWRTVISGFIATFIMAMVSFLQGGLGMPTIDITYLIHKTLNYIHGYEFYSIFWSNLAYIIGGILLALSWVVFLQERIPGNWLVHGFIYGIIITLFSGLVLAPLVALAAGDSFGIFYLDTWVPGKILLAAAIMHLSYALTLMLCLKIAGVNGLVSAS
ncbi:MAG: hypothetical protein EA359_03725 [Balneolaceae bacterium]|nr:MAG: hypothetical protein EA359_03725 [Balneolaceae bacterium]